jgi:hypothetical protein
MPPIHFFLIDATAAALATGATATVCACIARVLDDMPGAVVCVCVGGGYAGEGASRSGARGEQGMQHAPPEFALPDSALEPHPPSPSCTASTPPSTSAPQPLQPPTLVHPLHVLTLARTHALPLACTRAEADRTLMGIATSDSTIQHAARHSHSTHHPPHPLHALPHNALTPSRLHARAQRRTVPLYLTPLFPCTHACTRAEADRTLVGIATFDSTIQFFSLRLGASQPQVRTGLGWVGAHARVRVCVCVCMHARARVEGEGHEGAVHGGPPGPAGEWAVRAGRAAVCAPMPAGGPIWGRV